MDHQFYPPLNIDNVFNRSINDKVMARFGFQPQYINAPVAVTESRKEMSVLPTLTTNPIAKSFSQDMNAGGLLTNAYFSNPNLYRSPSAVTVNMQDNTNMYTTAPANPLKYLTYKPSYSNLYNPTFPNQSFTNVNLIHHQQPAAQYMPPPPPPPPPTSNHGIISVQSRVNLLNRLRKIHESTQKFFILFYAPTWVVYY